MAARATDASTVRAKSTGTDLADDPIPPDQGTDQRIVAQGLDTHSLPGSAVFDEGDPVGDGQDSVHPLLDEHHGNPSGVHSVSRRAKNAMEEAREQIAAILGARRPLEIVFTGGGTEADNLAVAGAALASLGTGDPAMGGVVTAATEHDAVRDTTGFLGRLGCPTTMVPVDDLGRIDPELVASSVDAHTAVVSIMLANNETGVVQPVATIARAVRDTGHPARIHTDAVQAFSSEDVTIDALGVDMLSLAAHKFGGPKGVGLLYVTDGITLEPVVHGGGQELGRRSGTHNVAGIVGMAAAMRLAVADRNDFRTRVGAARDGFEARLRSHIPSIEINAPVDARLPQHSHVRIPGVDVETLLIRLDQAGVAAAAGSACHSGAIDISHVLAAMGMDPHHAAECVRFSFGWPHVPADGPAVADIVASVTTQLRGAA